MANATLPPSGPEGSTDAPPRRGPLDARRARDIKQRVLERVADFDQHHLTIGAGQGDWLPFLPGVRIKLLHEHADGERLSYLLQLAPGASLPPHRHRADEECLVLEGSLRLGCSPDALGPGGYHLAHEGSLHATVHTDTGATIFLRGALPSAQDLLA